MLHISEYAAKGFYVVYNDGSSKKVSTGGSEVKIRGWGWTDLGTNQSFFRIPTHLPRTNSVGELVGAVNAARLLMRCSKLLLVMDSRYVKDRFGSVRK